MSSQSETEGKIIVALDLPLKEGRELLPELSGKVRIVKVGIEAINGGWAIPLALSAKEHGFEVMWDAKLHDIPSRVGATIKEVVSQIKPAIITVHCLGGSTMMRRAKWMATSMNQEFGSATRIFGVTLPTSTTASDFEELDFCDHFPQLVDSQERIASKACDLALLASCAGLDGVVVPVSALPGIKSFLSDLATIVPGVRPDWAVSLADDQEQKATPREAIEVGADYIVVGRPIVMRPQFGPTPKEALERIISEVQSAMDNPEP